MAPSSLRLSLRLRLCARRSLGTVLVAAGPILILSILFILSETSFSVVALPPWDLCTAIGQNRAVSRGFFLRALCASARHSGKGEFGCGVSRAVFFAASSVFVAALPLWEIRGSPRFDDA